MSVNASNSRVSVPLFSFLWIDNPDAFLELIPKFKSFWNKGIPLIVVPAIALSSSIKSVVISLYDTLIPFPPLANTPELICTY